MLEKGWGGKQAWRGQGSNRLPGLVTKQQAVEFPQVLASLQSNFFFFFHSMVVYSMNGLSYAFSISWILIISLNTCKGGYT